MLFHQSVRSLADDFYRELRRHYYATPTSYLELIQTYKELLNNKRKAVHSMQRRYQVRAAATRPRIACVHGDQLLNTTLFSFLFSCFLSCFLIVHPSSD